MTPAQQEQVEVELAVSLADIFDALGDARDLTRELEKSLDRIFQGELPLDHC